MYVKEIESRARPFLNRNEEELTDEERKRLVVIYLRKMFDNIDNVIIYKSQLKKFILTKEN